MVVTDEKSDEGMGMEGPDVPTQSEKVSVLVVNLEARVKCCVSDSGVGHKGLQPWVDYPIGGTCVDDELQCADAVLCRVLHMTALWWQELMPYAVTRMVRKLRSVQVHRLKHPWLSKGPLMR